ncbi:DNA internalization-related competence protein ComEC/Rec2 [Pseudoalteromonas sp. NEC-BIFX-2020_015]|uniref:DNA internalization-related competence protein ComEC/Rec2 n=1 Tax=Pseudoalteromonas sp. NEC-BIFX-2020_015 TaxID=2729544 RepID=UPI0032C22873
MWLSIGFVVGCLITVFYYQTLVFILFASSLTIASLYFKPFLPVLLGFICSILCVWVHFYSFYSINAEQLHENQSRLSTFKVVEVISRRDAYYLKVEIESIHEKNVSKIKPPLALVSLKVDELLSIGDSITTKLKLVQYRSQKNFDVFDKEQHAFSQRLFYKAKQIGSDIQITRRPKATLRQSYRDFIKQTYQVTQLNWLYYALLTGERSLMSFEQKNELQQFGLSHLLAISGLHIGLIFSIGFFVSKTFVSCFIKLFSQKLNLSVIYSFCGFSLAFCYVYLSDFLVSATRALIMLGCYLLVYYCSKQTLKWRSILFALVCVLVIDPFSLLSPGIYFSFIAVAIIFLIFTVRTRFPANFFTTIKMLVIIQLALTIGLLPLSLHYFGGVSFIGLAVNLIAIPLLSIVIMPCLVFISLLSFFVEVRELIALFDFLLFEMYQLLLTIPVDYRWYDTTKPKLAIVLGCYVSATIIYLFPRYFIIGLFPFCLVLVDELLQARARWQVDIFDVGHGTMALITIQNKGFMYDLGPIYFNQFSRIESTLIPYLKNNDIEVEYTVISHMDKDHAGGLNHWLKHGYADTFNLLQPEGVEQICLAGSYDFHSLKINVIENKGNFSSDNDNSCVIQISDGNFSVLLPGDISIARENELLSENLDLKSTVLLSPHHGSNTSSSEEFIDAVSPDVVIHSSAYKGQWQLPHFEVIERYSNKQIKQHVTGTQGQVQILFYQNSYRVRVARDESYWFLKD